MVVAVPTSGFSAVSLTYCGSTNNISFANISELTSLLPPSPNKFAFTLSLTFICDGLSSISDALYFKESLLLVTPLFTLACLPSSFVTDIGYTSSSFLSTAPLRQDLLTIFFWLMPIGEHGDIFMSLIYTICPDMGSTIFKLSLLLL